MQLASRLPLWICNMATGAALRGFLARVIIRVECWWLRLTDNISVYPSKQRHWVDCHNGYATRLQDQYHVVSSFTWLRTDITAPQISSPTMNCSPSIARIKFSQQRDAKPFLSRIIHLPPDRFASSCFTITHTFCWMQICLQCFDSGWLYFSAKTIL